MTRRKMGVTSEFFYKFYLYYFIYHSDQFPEKSILQIFLDFIQDFMTPTQGGLLSVCIIKMGLNGHVYTYFSRYKIN